MGFEFCRLGSQLIGSSNGENHGLCLQKWLFPRLGRMTTGQRPDVEIMILVGRKSDSETYPNLKISSLPVNPLTWIK